MFAIRELTEKGAAVRVGQWNKPYTNAARNEVACPLVQSETMLRV